MEKKKLTIEQLRNMRESEDHVEFKRCQQGNLSFNGSDKQKPSDRRKCILGYVVALANANGGYLVLGMEDAFPHKVVGTSQCENALGKLENEIYKALQIPVDAYELFDEQNNRVVVVEIPRHPVGKALRFEDVPLWRSGEELIPMPDKVLFSILQETDPDYSQAICEGVTIDDLDKEAIDILKEKYARKQNNPTFTSLSDRQALSDLKLIEGNKVTNAAVLLVGKAEIIQQNFPQAKVQHEFRTTEGQERFDKRLSFVAPFYILIDQLWKAVNDRNGSVPVQEGAYMFDIPFFNEEVIREVINNAFAHRDYRLASEIVIKQYPTKLSVISPGGFPIGVTLENILTVSSTPRNRLLADVLAATGIVERSGQGMDVIFRLTLSEGKQTPDYSKTNDYQVTAILSATVKDPGFALFIKSIQQELPENQKLSVFDVLTFCAIREGKQPKDKEIAKRLYSMGYLEKRGKTSAIRYILPRRYYELTGNQSEYSELTDWDDEQIWSVLFRYLKKYGTAKKTDIAKLIGQHISDSQLRRLLERLSEGPNPPLIKEGKTRNLTYSLSKDYLGQVDLLNEATRRGLSQMIQEVTQQNASFKTSIKSSDEINDEINT
ncbi:MAG: putative DNA binding domain-containing protein [Prevotella sp.]|jgi:ATP-dependent DNA helicase recG-related protein|uniref:ATP-binding protein n=1 Tax=Candidatus Limisoma sp. TaxID=3076476 RepID=UPI003065806A|nr:putative DNA binding domain-containing protein [Prevotella sp.]MBS7208076.1 putative DNA binding domain-containing protein [Prevotella sp.]